MLAHAEDDARSVDNDSLSEEDEPINEHSVVRNTFIHVATPILQKTAARRRARSLPNIRVTMVDQLASPTSLSHSSCTDQDPSEFTLNEEIWESETEEPHIHEDISDVDTDSSWPKQDGDVSGEW